MPKCRLCSREKLVPFVDLGMQPLANGYLSRPDDPDPQYPLEVLVCEDCFMVQTGNDMDPGKIFTEDYAFLSSQSETWKSHCRDYVKMITERFPVHDVCEIGSNDGCLLKAFRTHDPELELTGIEPAIGAAKLAQDDGIHTEVEFWGPEVAEKYRGRFDLIIANNVLAHTPTPRSFLRGVKCALQQPLGIFTFEVPYLHHLIENNSFDTIYHEHYSYFSIHSILAMLTEEQLYPFDIEFLDIHGGSLRIYACHFGQEAVITKIIWPHGKLWKEEQDLDFMAYYKGYAHKPEETYKFILSQFAAFVEAGQKVVVYGTPAKGNTLLNYCGIDGTLVDYAVDSTPFKQGKYLPGSHLPIYHPDRILETKPDIIWILPWNWKDEIVGKLDQVNTWGARYMTKDGWL